MSKELLDKLKIKPEPEIKPNIDIIIREPQLKVPVTLKTKIKDERGKRAIDRNIISEKLKDILDTKTLILE